MFDSLAEKFVSIFSKFSGQKVLTEKNISDSIREVRLALLDADVNYSVAKEFIQKVKEKALGQEKLKAVEASDQFIEIIHQELVNFLGEQEAAIQFGKRPSAFMLVGLQGAGKTTQAAKLAHLLQKKEYGRRPLLVACDLTRPAAVEQLRVLAAQVGCGFFTIEKGTPIEVAKEGLQKAKSEAFDVAIFDTAGRLHIDEALMKELEKIKSIIEPDELLFVANAAVGQDVVTTAEAFDKRLGITGTILTMLDSDTRGGAAISLYSITKKPIKFEGIGEKIDDFQLFNPKSMADRILDRGDTINLVKKAKEHIDEHESAQLEEKIKNASFTYEDYLKQMQAVKKMGSLGGLMKMMPKRFQLPDLKAKEKEFAQMEAIILSMTLKERQAKVELSMSRVKRIAKGSGTSVGEVRKIEDSYTNAKRFFKKSSNQKKLEQLMEKKTWP
jgi:signal recognition particle subunit SRP54